MTAGDPWTADALCTKADPDLFYQGEFTQGAGRHRNPTTAAAKKVCAQCPVSSPCLEYALQLEAGVREHRYGIWGGLSAQERDLLERKRA